MKQLVQSLEGRKIAQQSSRRFVLARIKENYKRISQLNEDLAYEELRGDSIEKEDGCGFFEVVKAYREETEAQEMKETRRDRRKSSNNCCVGVVQKIAQGKMR